MLTFRSPSGLDWLWGDWLCNTLYGHNRLEQSSPPEGSFQASAPHKGLLRRDGLAFVGGAFSSFYFSAVGQRTVSFPLGGGDGRRVCFLVESSFINTSCSLQSPRARMGHGCRSTFSS